MASQWQTLGRRLGKIAETIVFREGPKVLRQLQGSELVQRGLQRGLEAIGVVETEQQTAIPGRPVTNRSVPTAHRARRIEYAPDLDGRADPGEIVWTWVVYEDDPSQGKDRPVLVVGRDGTVLLGLMLSSQERHESDLDWVGLGSGSWDYDGRPSWVRLDRVLDVPEEGIRREGAILDVERFNIVATHLRTRFSWS
ncbi:MULTISPECIES: type II toxin-antitoxin system PemK/MazF family toxin [unclassified Mycobacterium]|uniref:type II toxin-antitoxin system PemK/MazF family toxin n=1 Tax=unclassified Mycobacterium TaxID=2642494 RepID=UPI000993B6C0|nr:MULTISPECIES: type II toxin-antitoxin system PemK/MazF family toxin [unclassified Mycobacterium]